MTKSRLEVNEIIGGIRFLLNSHDQLEVQLKELKEAYIERQKEIVQLQSQLQIAIEALELFQDITNCECYMDINTKWHECKWHKELNAALERIREYEIDKLKEILG